jgi:hypothetical protein
MTEQALFVAALTRPPLERAAFLASACSSDEALRKRVEALLAACNSAGDQAVPNGEANTEALGEQQTPDDHAVTSDIGAEPGRSDEALAFLVPSTRPGALGRIGHYDVLEVLGKGGFGIVLRAFDDVLQRVVAVKVLAPQMAATSPARKRFLREARSSAKVRHENVVQVYAVEEQPLPYLVMEFIPGETLQERLHRTGPMDVAGALHIGQQIAGALAAAHATGLIHRDIKPGNVMIEAGPHEHIRITDFGLARAADDASISQSGIVAGTPMYMAPEQAKGEALDHRADLFSLGSVLYVMCTGRPPFRANGTLAVLKRVVDDQPRPIREIIPEVPQWLCDIIAKLHAKDPDARFQTAREVADLLADCEAKLKAHVEVKFPVTDAGVKPTLRTGRKTWLAGAVLLTILALALAQVAGVTPWFGDGVMNIDPANAGLGAAPPVREPPRLVFDRSLTKPDTFGLVVCSRGQYSYGVDAVPGVGLYLRYGHTPSMIWPKLFLGESYRVQFEVQLRDNGWAAWTLNGPGYGNNPHTGYSCHLDKTNFWLRREGVEMFATPLPQPIAPADWVTVEAEINGGSLTVLLNGKPLAAPHEDPEPLTGPLHGRFGLCASEAVFRKLHIWTSAANPDQPLELTPPVTEPPLANGKLLYELKLADLETDWFQSQPIAVAREKGAVVLSGPNASPTLILTRPLSLAELACEVEFEYLNQEAVNFGIGLWRAKASPETAQDCEAGWQVELPKGDGTTTIKWHVKPREDGRSPFDVDAPLLASTPYYAPIAGRKYLARIETRGDDVRVFMNGGLLLTAKRPGTDVPEETPVFLGLRQVYGGSKVHAVRVYQMAAK